MEFIEFEEAGLRFEVQGPLADGGYLALVRAPGAEPRTHDCDTLGAFGRLVDRLVASRPAADREGGFAGFDIEMWDHEGGIVRWLSYPTRGALLQWFDDGSLPTPEEAAELAELPGNIVFEVRDARGNVLLDKRDEAEATVASIESRRWLP